MRHLLVTNDFPPKIGGIQTYLHELWRRLPGDDVVVLTTDHEGGAAWDADQGLRIERVSTSVFLPVPALAARVNALAAEVEAELIVLDPVWPLGMIAPQLTRPYGLVVHGAELTIPARLPFVQLAPRAALRAAALVIAAGGYPAAEARRAAGRTIPTVIVPPGVDAGRFVPLDAAQRASARASFGVDPSAVVLAGLSRLVPRKGFDTLLHAAAAFSDAEPAVQVLIAGSGRDRTRLEAIATALGVDAVFAGVVPDERLPAFYGCADIFAMICRDRWMGLEQEGFGIVFLEAAAAGLPVIAGASGGSGESVVHGETGFVVAPHSFEQVRDALATLIGDPALRARMGVAGRVRVERDFAYDDLAHQLAGALEAAVRTRDDASRTRDGDDDVANRNS